MHPVPVPRQESCPRLEVLDLSNMVVSSSAAASLPVEKLMLGCRRLRVLCWTNTAIRLGPEPEDEVSGGRDTPLGERASLDIQWGVSAAGGKTRTKYMGGNTKGVLVALGA